VSGARYEFLTADESNDAGSRSEFDLEGQHHPFRDEQDRAAKAGANLLLVRSRVVVPRRDLDCPAASPITDCPATLGA